MAENTLVSANTPSSGDGQAAGATGGAAPAAGTQGQQSSTAATGTTPAAAGATQTAADGQGAATGTAPAQGQSAEGDKGTDGNAGDKLVVLGAPEKYEFKSPDGVVFDDSVMNELSSVAKELDLSQGAAQKLVDSLAPKIAERTNAAMQDAIVKTGEAWAEAARSDKEFGGKDLEQNLGIAKKALDTFATPELRKLLDDSRLGNNPEVIRMLVRVGKQMSEDSFVAGGARPNGPARGAAEILYGTNQH